MASLRTAEDWLLRFAQERGPLLALDTSVATGSLALVTPSRLFEAELEARSYPSEALAEVLANTLAEAAVDPGSLAALCVGLGPGSFTGLRVALATAKGLALGAGVPVYGVSSLALIAAGHGPGLVAPVLDARRGEVFCSLYEVFVDGAMTEHIADGARSPAVFAEQLAPWVARDITVVGCERHSWGDVLAARAAHFAEVPRPRAALALRLVAARIDRGEAEKISELAPRYLRVSEAERQVLGGSS